MTNSTTTKYRLTTASGSHLATCRTEDEAQRAAEIFEAQGYGQITITAADMKDNQS